MLSEPQRPVRPGGDSARTNRTTPGAGNRELGDHRPGDGRDEQTEREPCQQHPTPPSYEASDWTAGNCRPQCKHRVPLPSKPTSPLTVDLIAILLHPRFAKPGHDQPL